MKILVTGASGFIGSHVVLRLLERGDEVVGLDNINEYYDTGLKYGRMARAGIRRETVGWDSFASSERYPGYRFIRIDLEDTLPMERLFAGERFDCVCHLAAQAGVRYSLSNPASYIRSNVDGFLNILEGCRQTPVKHLVYASSSSVYGLNADVPFSEKSSVAHPVSLYAASKKSNELMAHAYSHLYNLPCTGLRLFTVYGPWGRPDMSPFLFMDAIFHDKPIRVFNHGDMLRDFTYIDDIVSGIVRCIDRPAQPDAAWSAESHDPSASSAPYRIYNIGHSEPVKLMDFIAAIEEACGKEARKEFLPMQPGDVYCTQADTSLLVRDTGYKPATSVHEGVWKTVAWYKEFYQLK